jgi:hypothetical protein
VASAGALISRSPFGLAQALDHKHAVNGAASFYQRPRAPQLGYLLQLQIQRSWRFPSNSRVGVRSSLQFLGPDNETLTLSDHKHAVNGAASFYQRPRAPQLGYLLQRQQ